MTSITSDRFWKCYRELPEQIKKEAKKAYGEFKKNPYHPGLHFKRIHSTRPIFSLRITKDYRVVGIQQNNQVIWFWIGSHGDYDNLLRQLRDANEKFL
ncbi:MAG: ParE family toxin-like protein [Candidatus Humimicrobiaceae bacterium]